MLKFWTPTLKEPYPEQKLHKCKAVSAVHGEKKLKKKKQHTFSQDCHRRLVAVTALLLSTLKQHENQSVSFMR